MNKTHRDFCGKALLMLGLAGAILGVARAGYDADDENAGDGDAARSTLAQPLIQTLSEEKTEIAALAAQQAEFRKMGDRESTHLARLFGQMIRDHKAGGPTLMKLIKMHGGDPNDAKILMAPVMGSKDAILMAQHKAHQAAVMTSQMRWKMARGDGDWAVANFMHMRGGIARKHIRWMSAYHKM